MELPSHMDRIKGLVNPEDYLETNISLDDFELDLLLDDTILVRYADGDGDTVNRGGILVQNTMETKTWRVGQIILAGETCRYLKSGDFVLFPHDKGIKTKNIKLGGKSYPEALFLSETRVFGRLKRLTE